MSQVVAVMWEWHPQRINKPVVGRASRLDDRKLGNKTKERKEKKNEPAQETHNAFLMVDFDVISVYLWDLIFFRWSFFLFFLVCALLIHVGAKNCFDWFYNVAIFHVCTKELFFFSFLNFAHGFSGIFIILCGIFITIVKYVLCT